MRVLRFEAKDMRLASKRKTLWHPFHSLHLFQIFFFKELDADLETLPMDVSEESDNDDLIRDVSLPEDSPMCSISPTHYGSDHVPLPEEEPLSVSSPPAPTQPSSPTNSVQFLGEWQGEEDVLVRPSARPPSPGRPMVIPQPPPSPDLPLPPPVPEDPAQEGKAQLNFISC